jgi:hypothetical protein
MPDAISVGDVPLVASSRGFVQQDSVNLATFFLMKARFVPLLPELGYNSVLKSIRIRSGELFGSCVRFQARILVITQEQHMRKTITAAVLACFAAASFTAPVMADSLIIKVKPRTTVVKKVIIRKPCYYKTVKTYKNHKTIIVKKRICP